ncbi:ABC transporter permease [Bacillus luteolus]|uniref:Nickel import system permease protein NikB n=1 Tax=Litchfieldia luteola TaxID=682179 RepID=A0ABR9QL82_9BACI|nr:nickel ABC transporter permease [Cytobacillus luteolus]MBE4909253.1 ABC transporter permease [Cytobacillus luteolus]MBP1940290.1 peptide/nickel transport system permease protein [Cytobacillus luteolus]
MKQFIINRVLSGILVIFGISIFSFLLIHFIPGDPIKIMLGINATPEQVAKLNNHLGLDKPLVVQYGQYITNALQGDFGTSLKTGRPVLTEIIDRFPETVKLAVFGLFVAVVIGITLGILAARFKDSFIDKLCTVFATLGISIPSFWLAILLVLVFSVKLGWFPIANGTGLRDLILPSITLGVVASTMIMRLTRNGMVEVLSNEYIRTARAKGLDDRLILFRHALRNVLIPVVTVVGLQMAALLGGTVIIEQVFNWPGLGTLALGAIMSRDFPLIQGIVLFMGVVYVSMNILVDVLYSIIDPRVEIGTKEA